MDGLHPNIPGLYDFPTIGKTPVTSTGVCFLYLIFPALVTKFAQEANVRTHLFQRKQLFNGHLLNPLPTP